MSKNLLKIFKGDKEIGIDEALQRAREDEREQCNIDNEKKRKAEILRIEGEWDLKVKEIQAKLDSVNLRMNELEEKEKKLETERQKWRQIAMLIRRVMSDIKYFSDKEREEGLEKRQSIDRLMQESEGIDKLMIE